MKICMFLLVCYNSSRIHELKGTNASTKRSVVSYSLDTFLITTSTLCKNTPWEGLLTEECHKLCLGKIVSKKKNLFRLEENLFPSCLIFNLADMLQSSNGRANLYCC